MVVKFSWHVCSKCKKHCRKLEFDTGLVACEGCIEFAVALLEVREPMEHSRYLKQFQSENNGKDSVEVCVEA